MPEQLERGGNERRAEHEGGVLEQITQWPATAVGERQPVDGDSPASLARPLAGTAQADHVYFVSEQL